jgi:hypothetical protein
LLPLQLGSLCTASFVVFSVVFALTRLMLYPCIIFSAMHAPPNPHTHFAAVCGTDRPFCA